MVTQLLRAVTLDVMSTVKDADFFDLTQAKRDSRVNESLPDYPSAVQKYVRSTSGDQFLEDAQEVMEVLGSGSSVINESPRLVREKNAFFTAMLDSLNEIRSYTNKTTRLGQQIISFKEAGAKYARVLDREMQTLLLIARDEDSPIVQIAAKSDIDVSELPGVPSVQIQQRLLGGARIFHNGKLNDDSWRSRLTQVLSAIS